MKPSHRSNLCALAVALFLFIAHPLFAATEATFYVSPSGNDSNAGSINAPFLTIARAQTAVRSLSGSMTGDIIVYLRAGTYPLSTPLAFGVQDSGTNGYHVIYQAYQNEVPVISGGVPVTGWTLVSGSIYSAPLSRSTKLRSLFVNGVRAPMTKSAAVTGYGNEGTFTIPANASYSIGGATGSFPADVQFSASTVGFYANPGDIELVQGYTFNASIYTVSAITNVNGNPDFQLQQPYGAIGANVPIGGLQPSGTFEIQNAYELLNTPGQFYFNRTTQTLYYYSRGENMATAQVIAPTTEGLMTIHGVSNTNRATNIEFLGITFAYDHWQMYNVAGSYGMVALQSTAGEVKFAGSQVWSGDLWNDTQDPQASIDVQNASGIVFEGDSFQHLSSGTALGFTDDVINSTILGNSFVDLSGNSINVGNAQNAYPNTSLTYPPSLWGVCINDIVQDNLIRFPNQLYYQFEGISAYYVNGLQIVHNDISGTGYDNITMGWGWDATTSSTSSGNNTVSYNRADRSNQIVNQDGGSTYYLGPQPNTVISNNYVSNGGAAFYEDAGSSGLTIENNVISNEAWLYISDPSDNNILVENNYYNTNVDLVYSTNNITLTNNTYETTFDSTAQAIINASGLESSYQYLLNAPVPADLNATTATGGVQLSWQSTGYAASYNIYRSTTKGGEGSTPYLLGISGSSYLDTGASLGTNYYYKVTAVGLAGESSPSNEATNATGTTGTTAQTITFNAIPSQIVGGSLTVYASASSGLPITWVIVQNGNCSISGSIVTFLNTGNCGVIAFQNGNSIYAAAQAVGQIIVVNSPTSQTISFTTPASQAPNTMEALTATASSGLTVSFASTTASICTVEGSTATLMATGTCSITASQPGNNVYAAATPVSRSFTVTAPLSQTITFSSVPQQHVGGTLTISATASSGLPVTFTIVQNGNCSISGNVVTFLNVGNCGVIANQAGNGTYAAAPAVGQVIVVNQPVAQTITFGSLPNNEGIGNTLTVSATASSGLAVVFSVVPNGNCSVSGNVVTFLNVGNCGVLANQPGNGTYSAAPQVGQIAVVTH
jgi:hypothetical protein